MNVPEERGSGPSVAPDKGGSSWPLVGIVPDLKVRGWKGIGKPQSTLEFVPLDEALQRTDVGPDCCLVSYFVPGEDRAPRLNKGAEGFVRKAGGDVLTGCLVMDYDLPKDREGRKQEWDRGLREEFFLRWNTAAVVVPELEHPHATFFTRHGARAIWLYEEPVSVERGEAFAKSFHAWCRSAGLEFDESALDWTRLSRLPYAPEGVAVGLVTDSSAPRLKPQDGPVAAPLPREVQVSGNHLRPNEADVAAVVGSDWWMQAKSALEPTKYHDPLYTADHGPLTQPGERNATFMKFVGAVVHYVGNLPGTTPGHIYAVMHAAAEAAYASCPEGEDWRETVWGMVQRVCDQERITYESAAEQEERIGTKTERLLRGVREWCKDSSLAAQLAGPDAMDVLREYLIVTVAGSSEHYVMTQEGYYDSIPVKRHSSLLARIRELRMTDFIETRVPRADGKGMRLCNENEILELYSTTVQKIESRADIPGNFVRRLGTKTATLVLRTYELRKDLEPRFDPEVDEWLKHFFGKENYDAGIRWIAHSLDLGNPIAGLSLKGPPACGKKLLAQGLAECIDTERYLDSSVFGKWNNALAESPFVVVNEGLPSSLPGEKSFADRVKDYIGGDRIVLSTKFLADRVLLAVPRVIFTSNDLEILASLAKGKDMTPEARRSLAQRIIHFDLPDNAGTWLAGKGGKAWTARPGRRWIQGDTGQDSDYVVAKHFLYLYRHRSRWPANTGRLLVEGDAEAAWTHQVALSSGASAWVVRALCEIAKKWAKQEHIHDEFLEGIYIDRDRGGFYATASGVMSWIQGEMEEKTSAAAVGRALTAVAGPEGGKRRRLRKQSLRWTHIDLNLVLDEARRHGYSVGAIEDLLAQESVRKTNDQVEETDDEVPF